MGDRIPPRRPVPAPVDLGSYIAQAEACLVQAAITPDKTARALHEQECALWLMLARQRRAIDDVVQTYASETDDKTEQ